MKNLKRQNLLVYLCVILSGNFAEAADNEMYVGDTATYKNTYPIDNRTNLSTTTLVSFNPVTDKFVEEIIYRNADGSLISRRSIEIDAASYLGSRDATKNRFKACERIYRGTVDETVISGVKVATCTYIQPPGPYGNGASVSVGNVPFGGVRYEEDNFQQELIEFKRGTQNP